MTTSDPIDDFITRWQRSGAAERANFQQFAVELCDLLGVDRPDPSVAEERHNSYVFEKSVPPYPVEPRDALISTSAAAL
jgi:hypothetical protein